MIFALTDETYSILCNDDNLSESDQHSYRFFVSLFNQCYWVIGSIIGSIIGRILGSLITFNTVGIDFSMTALFVVILLEQVIGAQTKAKVAASFGLFVSLICLLLLGTERFLLPSLLIIVFILAVYSTAEKSMKGEEKENE